MKNVSLNFQIALFCRRVWVWTLFFTLLGAALPAMSLAQQAPALGATLKAGTPGIGGDLTLGLHPKFNTRLGFNVFGLSLASSETNDEGVTEELQADLKWLTIPVFLDWHPWESGMRFSLGAMINKNRIDISNDTASVEINEVEYAVESVEGKISFNTLSPYLGIGYGNAADTNGHWHFACDVGVMFQGAPQVDFSGVATNPAQQADLDADLDEESSTWEEDFKVFTMYPIVSLGVSYTF